MGSINEIWCVTVLKGIRKKERIVIIKESLNEVWARYVIKNKRREKEKREGFRRKIW